MKIQIDSISVMYEERQPVHAQIQFTGYDDSNIIRISGSNIISIEEYEKNKEIENLEELVKKTISDEILEEENKNQ